MADKRNFENNFKKVHDIAKNSKKLIATIESGNNPDISRIREIKNSTIRTCENFLNFYHYPVNKENITAIFGNRINDIKQDVF